MQVLLLDHRPSLLFPRIQEFCRLNFSIKKSKEYFKSISKVFLDKAFLRVFNRRIGVCRRTPKNFIDSANCSLKIEKSW
jgi:hypothetical protein